MRMSGQALVASANVSSVAKAVEPVDAAMNSPGRSWPRLPACPRTLARRSAAATSNDSRTIGPPMALPSASNATSFISGRGVVASAPWAAWKAAGGSGYGGERRLVAILIRELDGDGGQCRAQPRPHGLGRRGIAGLSRNDKRRVLHLRAAGLQQLGARPVQHTALDQPFGARRLAAMLVDDDHSAEAGLGSRQQLRLRGLAGT